MVLVLRRKPHSIDQSANSFRSRDGIPASSGEKTPLRGVAFGGFPGEAGLRELVQAADHVAREEGGVRGDVGIGRLLAAFGAG